MYKDSPFSSIDKSHPLEILIVKMSSLGDIIQTFHLLHYLRRRFPQGAIDWISEETCAPIPAAHPWIRTVFSFDIQGLKRGWWRWRNWRKMYSSIRALRKKSYHLIFDLQGNCKSGVLTFFARGGVKVGFAWRSVREWPNVLATHLRFEVPQEINIRLQHLHLAQQLFSDGEDIESEGVRFKISDQERQRLDFLLQSPQLQTKWRALVCPGSKWINKQLPLPTLLSLLKQIREALDASYLLVWGGEEERVFCEEIRSRLPSYSALIERLELPTLQNLMSEVDLVLAVDSSALHLCGTTATPSFSVFGPTSPHIFKPIGSRHFAFQGQCPYGKTFTKQCPLLRSCPTGACIRDLNAEEIFRAFMSWWRERGGVS